MKFYATHIFMALSLFGTVSLTQAADNQPTTTVLSMQASTTQVDPVEVIRTLTNGVLADVRSDPDIQKGDAIKVQGLVAKKIVPYVDFERMTQLAAGRFWREATPEQRVQITDQFRQLLIYTYSGALTQIKDQKVEFKRMRVDPSDTDLIIRSRVIQGNGQEPISLDYRVEKSPHGWKIYDVNVLGAWLIEAYKDTFTSEIQKGGVDGLIKVLEKKNDKLAKKFSQSTKQS